jgi:iron complex outermembrane receptor protein
MDYSYLQVSNVRGNSVVIENAAQAETIGFELELKALITDTTTLDLAYGYLDAEFTEFMTDDPTFLELGTLDLAGNTLPHAPDHSLSVGLKQDFNLPYGTLSIRGDLRYRGERFFNAYNRPTAFQDGYAEVDARVTFEHRSGRWGISAWGRNLFKKDAILNNFVNSGLVGFNRNGMPNAPQRFGIDFLYRM